MPDQKEKGTGGPVKLQEGFLNAKLSDIVGSGDKNKLVFAEGMADYANGETTPVKTLCLKNEAGRIEPISILGYAGYNIFSENIKWEKDEPIELATAIKKGFLPEDDLKKIQSIIATNLRMEGKSQVEIVKKLVELEEESEKFKI
jgi:hypothetical protein